MAKREKPKLVRVFDAEDENGQRGTHKTVRMDSIKEGERRHEKLPPELEARAVALLDRIGKLLGRTRQQWVDGFCYDMHPDREIAVWEKIADIVDELWVEQPKQLKHLSRERLSRLVIAVSFQMVDIPAQMGDVTDEGVALVKAIYESRKAGG